MLYRIRWQIELLFKLSKSTFGLNHIASLRPARIMTEFYARLIGIILTFYLSAPLRQFYGPNANCEISPTRISNILRRCARELLTALHHRKRFSSRLDLLFCHATRYGFKDKRNRKPNILFALEQIALPNRPDDNLCQNNLCLA